MNTILFRWISPFVVKLRFRHIPNLILVHVIEASLGKVLPTDVVIGNQCTLDVIVCNQGAFLDKVLVFVYLPRTGQKQSFELGNSLPLIYSTWSQHSKLFEKWKNLVRIVINRTPSGIVLCVPSSECIHQFCFIVMSIIRRKIHGFHELPDFIFIRKMTLAFFDQALELLQCQCDFCIFADFFHF